MTLKCALVRTITASAALAVCATGFAQKSPFPSSPPSDLPARPFKLGATTDTMLANGVRLVIIPDHRFPIFTVRLGLRAGTRLDPVDSPGLASATAAMLSEGTSTRTSAQIAKESDALGGSVGASAQADYTVVSVGGLAENFRPLVGLFADMLLHPTFQQSELESFRSRALQGLVVQLQNPDFLARKHLYSALFGPDNPYGVVSTNRTALQAMTRDALLKFYRTRYLPKGAVIVITGDVTPALAVAALTAGLKGWTPLGAESDASPPEPPASDSVKVILINRPGSVQSNILMGELGITRKSPYFYGTVVGNTVLGGDTGSRLFTHVREKDGYAYDVRSAQVPFQYAGLYTLSAQTRTAVTIPAIKDMLADTRALLADGATPAELKSARNYAVGIFGFLTSMQASLADQTLNGIMNGMGARYLSDYRRNLAQVTASQVHEAMSHVVDPSHLTIVVVGDAATLRDGLKEFGPVEEQQP